MKNNKLVKLISSFIIGVMFILAVLAVLIVTGVISFGKAEITLQTGSKDALYNGSPLTNHEVQIIGDLKEGHRIEYEYISSQTEVGECPNELQYKIFDELDADVTADYNVKHEYGTLKVNPRIVLVICQDTKGRVPQKDEYTVDEEAYDGLVFDHKLVFRAVTEEETADGEASTEADGARSSSGTKTKWKPVVYDRKNNDVTSNYHIIVNVNVNNGNTDADDILDSEELAEKMFEGDSNMIPPAGNRNTVLFSVKADNKNKAYLKMESYGNYNGQEWRSARYYSSLINDQYSASYLTSAALDNVGAKSYNMSIISQCGKYALPYYLAMSSASEPQLSDTQTSGNTDSEYQVSYYQYSSSAQLANALAEYEEAYAAFVREQYLTVDDETLEYMNGIIQSEGFDANDPQIITKVAKYIQGSAEYNLEYDPYLDTESNVAIAFLDVYKEGVCSHYSTAATLLYRALGIPARYTVGVVAYPNGSDYVDVLAKNAHAWVEVYIDGMGWTYVEVTGVIGNNNVEVGESPSGASECELYGHDMFPIDAQDPTCTEIGWTEHFACGREECEYKDGYVEIPAMGHDKEFVDYLAPTCVADGNKAHWTCNNCGCFWDEDGETPLKKRPTLNAKGHNKKNIPYLDSTCEDDGNESYYVCTRCDGLWESDRETPIDDIPIIEAKGHIYARIEKQEPTCVVDGHIEHYVCEREGCGWLFDIDNQQKRLQEKDVVLPALGHKVVEVEAVEPTCQRQGNYAYSYCSVCNCHWDENGNEIMEAPIRAQVRCEATDPVIRDPEDHCNIKCKYGCGTVLIENDHQKYACDPEDGYKEKCTNCGDELKEKVSDEIPNINRVIYTVIADSNDLIYLRETSKNYTGNGFVVIPDFSQIYEEIYATKIPYSPNYLASLTAGNSGASLHNVIIIDSADKNYGLPVNVKLEGDYAKQYNDIQYEGSVENMYSAPYYSYDFLAGAEPSAPNDAEYKALEAAYRDFVYKTYLGLDEETKTLARGIVNSNGWSYSENASYAAKIATINSVAVYIREYREYDGTYKAEAFANADNWAKIFFDKTNSPSAKAVCRHYTAAAIAIYKELGIPARYVSGVAVQGVAGQMVDVYENSRHAWVELYIDGIGWITVDVTGTSSEGNPEDDNKPVVNLKVGGAALKYEGGKTLYYDNSSEVIQVTGAAAEKMGLPKGYSCEYKVLGWASTPGKHSVIQAYGVVITDAAGNNVTGNYKIKKTSGVLHIYRDILYFESESYERVYDGTVPGGEVTLTKGSLAEGHSLQDPVFTGSSKVGEVLNTFKITISNGTKDVTDEYIIKTTPGKVTTNRKKIVITAGSLTIDYDTWYNHDTGEFIYHKIEPVDGLVIGHRVDEDNLTFDETNGMSKIDWPGEADNKINKDSVVILDGAGESVTDCYEITLEIGKLVITEP